MSEFNTLTERELANVSGGEGVVLLLLLHRKFPILLRGFKKDTRKLKKEINAAKNIN